MEVSGTIISVLPEQSGEGRNGPWRKQEFIVETDGQYPRKVCVALWGDRIDEFAIQEGERITASVNIESREFNNRWYTDVKAWRITKDPGAKDLPGDAPPPSTDVPPPDAEDPQSSGSEEDDLPF